MYLIKLLIARARLKMHCFFYLHEPAYYHYHTRSWSRVWRVRCKFCQDKIYFTDKVLYEANERASGNLHGN